MLKHINIPIFIPELACPHQCVFCDQKKISGRLKTPGIDEIKSTINNYLSSVEKANCRVEIAFFGGNFTGLAQADQKIYLDIAQEYVDKGMADGIRMSTRPDYINAETIKFLSCYSISTIELGAQSFDDNVLNKSGRGHTVADIINASGLIKQAGISLGLQMMTGLPASSPEAEIKTAMKIIELGADNTRIYPALVIKGTKLEELYNEGKYKPQTMEEAVEICAKLYKLFEAAGVTILKLGLHPSEGLLSGCDLAAGQFHLSFRELVLTALWKELLQDIPSDKSKGDSVIIEVPPGEINYAAGYGASNKNMLLRKFAKVKYRINTQLTGRTFNVIHN